MSSTAVLPRLISCDESGFTGNDMLTPSQPYFGYASHDLSLQEAEDLIVAVRARHRIQMPELKASKLLKSSPGRKVLIDILDATKGRYIATIYDKRLSLMCKIFEYIYEPVLQENNALFYRNNLHRFVAMYLYVLMKDEPMQIIAAEFEAFMRSLDPANAPTIFGTQRNDAPNELIGQILRFAKGYNATIAEETKVLERTEDTGKWVLDLSLTAVFSHLATWGERHPVIDVVCDDSKPLRAMTGAFDAMIDRKDAAHFEGFGKRRAITWNMSGPIAFASSHIHAGIQIADVIAGVACALPEVRSRKELIPFLERVSPHMQEDCILPDTDVLDLDRDETAVNWIILEELAARGDRGDDPLEGMAMMYEIAKGMLPEFRRARLRSQSSSR